MKKLIPLIAVAAAAAIPSASSAALEEGATAPVFATQGALAGETFAFNLRSALQKGPVVLYFFPKAFTPGCTLEANAFAAAIDDFKAAGAQVIGLSADNMEELKQFSVKECGSKFPVAMASPAVIEAYDVALEFNGQQLSDRTSYVIGQDGKVAMVHSEMDYKDHVRLTLAAVQAMKKGG
jgi:peroxiredoxin